MNYIELFAGKGGFRRGLETLGHRCVGWVEWDKYARISYQAIWAQAREEWNANDITTVTDDAIRGLSERVGGVDLIAGGFPCQAFSVAGKRGGFEDTRGTLFFEVARFASILRPKYLLLENVVGLLNHDDGRTFHTILCALDELGYDAEWQVCNATDFGIPQNRERVFIVGHLRGRGGRKVFPLPQTDGEVAGELVMVGMLDIKGQDAIRRVYSPTGVSPTLTTMAGGNREPKVVINNDARGGLTISETVGTLRANSHGNLPMVEVESGLIHSRGFETRKDGISHCIKGAEGGSSKNFIKVSAVLTPDREEKRQNGRRIKDPDEPMFTLTAQDKHSVCIPVVRNQGEWSEREMVNCLPATYYKGIDNHGARTGISDGTRIRKLTPLECWRLMGRADWEFERAKVAGVSDSQLYKQAGNGLIPQIVTAIASRFEEGGI